MQPKTSATQTDIAADRASSRKGWLFVITVFTLMIGVVPGFEAPMARADGDGGEGGCWLCEEFPHNGVQVHEDHGYLTDSKDGDPHWEGVAGTCAFFHNPYKAPPKGGGGGPD